MFRRWGCPWDENACLGAALYGRTDALTHAYERGRPAGDHIQTVVIASECMHSVRWMRGMGMLIRDLEHDLVTTAYFGSLRILEYFIHEGLKIQFEFDFCYAGMGAVYGGHVSVLNHVWESGIPPESFFDRTGRNGRTHSRVGLVQG
jgi:hypothetical protein